MDRKKLMLLVGALVIAIGTALAARSMFTGASTRQAQAAAVQQAPQGPKVLVAQRVLPAGTIITADSIGFQAWPKDMVRDAYFVEGEADMSKLLGTVVRYPVTAGQPVTQGSLVKPGDRGFLAAALGAGMRAVTISVSAKTGVAGFVFPGDHIDLMLTQTVRGGDDGQALKATETILRNLRVLATDQSTESEVVDGKTVVHEFRTVTLEVTPRIGAKIAVAETIGTLSIALRSIADNQTELDRLVASGQVKVPTGATKLEEDRILTAAMNKPDDSKGGEFVTGADVSRFQRAGIPGSKQAAAMAQPGNQARGGAGGIPVLRVGPVVRVTRGKVTTEEEVRK